MASMRTMWFFSVSVGIVNGMQTDAVLKKARLRMSGHEV